MPTPNPSKAPSYTPADLDKPKVKGLAVHNATLATNRARVEHDERKETRTQYIVPPEVCSYCLFLINQDCSVVAVASAATASDFAKSVSAANLSALASKYRPIGFIAHRDAQNPKRAQMVILPVPHKTKGGAK